MSPATCLLDLSDRRTVTAACRAAPTPTPIHTTTEMS